MGRGLSVAVVRQVSSSVIVVVAGYDTTSAVEDSPHYRKGKK